MASPPDDDTDIGKMHFTRMDVGTDADYQVLARVHEHNLQVLPDLLLDMLTDLDGDANYPIDRLQHSLQVATRALRDGADEEMIVCGLLHDIAAILRPFISEANYWMLFHHGLFQTYFYARHLGLDPDAREQFKDNPNYQLTVDFTTNWDEVSFDPDYPNEPVETFVPMVHRVLDKPWTPPNPTTG
jgi:predicted HD phosphohydrolase